jgi:hypothetical protein
MAFKGNIEDLSLIDVLQLISQSGKTGIIHVISDELDAQVFLKEGKLIDIKSEGVDLGIKIGAYLLHKEVITKEELEVLLEKQNKMPVRFGTLLVNEGYITKEKLKDIMAELLKERFLRVLSIDKGTYDFEQTIVEYNPEEVKPIDLNSILLDILKDLDEIKLFKTKIKGFDISYIKSETKLNIVIDDKVTNDEPVLVEKDIVKLNKNSYLVYSFIDGKYTINDIVDKTALSEHFVLKVIFNLYNIKLIKLPDSISNKINDKPKLDRRKLMNIITYIAILLLIALYAFSLYQFTNINYNKILFRDYKKSHNLKNHILETNLTHIYKIEYPKQRVDLKKLKIYHRQKYYEFGGL